LAADQHEATVPGQCRREAAAQGRLLGCSSYEQRLMHFELRDKRHGGHRA
jgi:hypothetical protein